MHKVSVFLSGNSITWYCNFYQIRSLRSIRNMILSVALLTVIRASDLDLLKSLEKELLAVLARNEAYFSEHGPIDLDQIRAGSVTLRNDTVSGPERPSENCKGESCYPESCLGHIFIGCKRPNFNFRVQVYALLGRWLLHCRP